MSALPPIADILRGVTNVRFVPKAHIVRHAQTLIFECQGIDLELPGASWQGTNPP